MANVDTVHRLSRQIAADKGMPPEVVEGIICNAAPILLPLIERLAEEVADDSFWLWRFIIRDAADAVVGLIRRWVERTCTDEE